jgi:hypothetical protein
MTGVFQTDREIFDNPVWKNVLKFRLFFYIYGNAVYLEEGIKYSGIHVKRGQLLKSYRKLQEGLEYIENHAVKQYSLSQIKRAIDELVNEGRMSKSDTELGTLFTICNYEEYQGFERFQKDSIEQRKNTDRTLLEQMKNNNKKDNKDNKEKNKNIGDFTSDIELQKALKDFSQMRNKLKKPLTDRALKMLWNELNKLSPDTQTQIKILEQSIMNCWQTVYPLKNKSTKEDKSEQAKREAIEELRQEGLLNDE